MRNKAEIIADRNLLEAAAYVFCHERGLLSDEGKPGRPASSILQQLRELGLLNGAMKLQDEAFGYACYEYYRQLESPGYFDRLLRQEAAGRQRIADVGCGAGATIHALLHEEGVRSHLQGIDRNAGQLALLQELIARRIIPHDAAIDCTVADACRLPLEAATYDMVVCRAALQYMDVEASLAEMYRILQPGGKLLVVVHGSGYGIDYIWRRKGAFRQRTLQYFGKSVLERLGRPAKSAAGGSQASHFFTKRGLRMKLEAAGFASVQLYLDPHEQRLGKLPVYVGAVGEKKGG